MAQAKEKAGQAASGAQDKAQQVAGQAQEKAQEAKGQAGGKLREQVGQRSTVLGEQVRTTAQDMRCVGQQLGEQAKDQRAKLADPAAEGAERLGGHLKESGSDRMLGDVEDFGRRQPLAVAAAGLALGFAASRFLKASSSQRYESRGVQGQSPRRTSYPTASPEYAPGGRYVTA